VRDLYVVDGRIVAAPGPETRIDSEIDLRGRVVMACHRPAYPISAAAS